MVRSHDSLLLLCLSQQTANPKDLSILALAIWRVWGNLIASFTSIPLHRYSWIDRYYSYSDILKLELSQMIYMLARRSSTYPSKGPIFQAVFLQVVFPHYGRTTPYGHVNSGSVLQAIVDTGIPRLRIFKVSIQWFSSCAKRTSNFIHLLDATCQHKPCQER